MLRIPRLVIFKDSELIESDSDILFQNDKLVIKQEYYPGLEVIHANNCGLAEIDID